MLKWVRTDYIKPALNIGVLCSLGIASAYGSELPNFEIGIGAGSVSSAKAYNLDLTINFPLPSYFSSQVILDSDYISGDTPIGSYSQSEFSGLLYARNSLGSIGAGLGQKQNKPRDANYESESTVIGHLSAALYLENFTLSTRYINHDSDLDNSTSNETSLTYFSTPHKSVSVIREVFDEEESWRIEMASRYGEGDLSSIRMIARDGSSDDAFYFAIQYRYYFDSRYSLQDRDRMFY